MILRVMLPYYKSGPNLLGSFLELRSLCLVDGVMWPVACSLCSTALVSLGSFFLFLFEQLSSQEWLRLKIRPQSMFPWKSQYAWQRAGHEVLMEFDILLQ